MRCPGPQEATLADDDTLNTSERQERPTLVRSGLTYGMISSGAANGLAAPRRKLVLSTVRYIPGGLSSAPSALQLGIGTEC